ncbi:hypothetical protein HPB51_006942 [Rhipicephalus microplus]|uniref:Uncharacterized protein n=1 Tax=Rhipicephalus microplus TaxID=6941 RepID=A0A9J6DTL7_RHIMP|nr:hypothetical protein HPB51_006942 [Rhipicephalus microplus]
MLRCRRSRDPGGQHHEFGQQRWRRPWKSFVDCLSVQCHQPPLLPWPVRRMVVLYANAAAFASTVATRHWDVVACLGHRCLLLPRHLDQVLLCGMSALAYPGLLCLLPHLLNVVSVYTNGSRVGPGAEGSRAARGVMANTSSLLDSLLSEKNYNRQFRPGFGGPYPSAVSVCF